jgi:hypothetical protein
MTGGNVLLLGDGAGLLSYGQELLKGLDRHFSGSLYAYVRNGATPRTFLHGLVANGDGYARLLHRKIVLTVGALAGGWTAAHKPSAAGRELAPPHWHRPCFGF